MRQGTGPTDPQQWGPTILQQRKLKMKILMQHKAGIAGFVFVILGLIFSNWPVALIGSVLLFIWAMEKESK